MDILEYERSQETKFHGHGNFPFNIYLCSIPLDFTVVHTHWHNDMENVYIKKGMGTIAVNLCPFKVSQGDIVVIPPGQLHSIQQIPGHSMEYENIIFQLSILMAPKGDLCTTEFFHPLRQGKISFDSHYPAGSLHHSGLAECLDAMDEICKNFPPGYQLAIKGQLFTFFYRLRSCIQAPMPRQRNKSLDRLKGILKYVETNYSEKISIDDAARICNFSKSHFMKFFKEHMTISFTDYLNDYRLTIAARFLSSSEDTIANIAVETGFGNLSYFNRSFKRKYQCTPTEFRKKTQKYSIS